MGFLCAFGFVGNSLSTLCLSRDGSKSATPFLLVSLQVADTLFLMAVVWLRVITSVEETFPDEAASIGYLKPYIGKYAYPCAMVAETGRCSLQLYVTQSYNPRDKRQYQRQSRIYTAQNRSASILRLVLVCLITRK